MMYKRPVWGERLIMMRESETSHRLGVRFENRQKFTSESGGNSDSLEISSLFVIPHYTSELVSCKGYFLFHSSIRFNSSSNVIEHESRFEALSH